MKVLVTGAGGQLGKEWAEFLEQKGISFAGFGSGELDITNRKQVGEVLTKHQPNIVINCAAYTGVDAAEGNKKQAFEVNENGVLNLTNFCALSGIKLVHYSTDYVFPGRSEDRNSYPGGYPETAETKPVNVYGQSKLAGEQILQQSGCEYLLIRVSWLCGSHGNNFVKTMLNLAAEHEKLSIVADQFGAPTFTFDVVEKTWQLVEKKGAGTWHISSRGIISWADFAEEIFHLSDLKTEVERITSEQYPQKARRPKFSYLSTDKLEQAGIEPLNWKKGLHSLLKKLKNQQK